MPLDTEFLYTVFHPKVVEQNLAPQMTTAARHLINQSPADILKITSPATPVALPKLIRVNSGQLVTFAKIHQNLLLINSWY